LTIAPFVFSVFSLDHVRSPLSSRSALTRERKTLFGFNRYLYHFRMSDLFAIDASRMVNVLRFF
jgi:hypothetical protein